MRIILTGASGFIGAQLVPHLESHGHQTVRLVRRPPSNQFEHQWSPGTGDLDSRVLDGADAVINLAGAGVGDHRWTKQYKEEILSSRLNSTRTLVDAIHRAKQPPPVMVNASAIGFYGDRGEESLDETSKPGAGFLAEVCEAWEHELIRLPSSTRQVRARTGIVLGSTGGALAKLQPLIKAGVAGPLGSGKQWWSWIAIDDVVRAYEFVVREQSVVGPVNFVSPDPRRNKDVIATIARRLHRPALFPAPAVALRSALGGFASDLLSSSCITPRALKQAGFTFNYPTIGDAAEWIARS
ncbi:hypothetical protein BAURA86_00580 [Brevibacterium aurantiacum]|uniref:TIGR01777 family protein n=1 Tax=Brevibacterium aurantiacum TaxID=273384 RepID=A0A2H1IIN2_BREAU|nr:TIGR01777 family oxidoreductase [Brevibacterium aurantiacum]SMX75077.1 hypothetical protein BAURA86_00580 [Brevibacterium aurantiacum]